MLFSDEDLPYTFLIMSCLFLNYIFTSISYILVECKQIVDLVKCIFIFINYVLLECKNMFDLVS